jgi:hypothetical protein
MGSPLGGGSGRPWTRRRFLQWSGWAAAGLGLGAAALGCADEELNPDHALLIWVAQWIEGTVREQLTTGPGVPIADAFVRFSASLDPDFPIPLATGRTDASGYFRMSAARPGIPNNFWALEVSEDRRFTLFYWVLAGKDGFQPAEIRRSVFPREPSRTPPTGNLSPYQLTQTVLLRRDPGAPRGGAPGVR